MTEPKYQIGDREIEKYICTCCLGCTNWHWSGDVYYGYAVCDVCGQEMESEDYLDQLDYD